MHVSTNTLIHNFSPYVQSLDRTLKANRKYYWCLVCYFNNPKNYSFKTETDCRAQISRLGGHINAFLICNRDDL